jgi:hypothetical protein
MEEKRLKKIEAEEKAEAKLQDILDGELPKKMFWMLSNGHGIPELITPAVKPWKRGPNTDRIRINRVRSYFPRYHRALDVPEIYERIMVYLDADSPLDALNFSRAMETLGCWENRECRYLFKKRKDYFYTHRTSLGKLRSKMVGGKHCHICGMQGKWLYKDPPKTYARKRIITQTTRLCWSCLNAKFPMAPSERAFALLSKGGHLESSEVKELLHCGKHGIPAFKYGSKVYYSIQHIKMARKTRRDEKKALRRENLLADNPKKKTKMDVEAMDSKKCDCPRCNTSL